MWDCLTISQKKSYEYVEKELIPKLNNGEEVKKDSKTISPKKCLNSSFINIVDINLLKNLNYDDHDNSKVFSNDPIEARTEYVLDMKRVPCFKEDNSSQ